MDPVTAVVFGAGLVTIIGGVTAAAKWSWPKVKGYLDARRARHEAERQRIENLEKRVELLGKVSDSDDRIIQLVEQSLKMRIGTLEQQVGSLTSLLNEMRDQLDELRKENERLAPIVDRLDIALGDQVAATVLPDAPIMAGYPGGFPLGDIRNARTELPELGGDDDGPEPILGLRRAFRRQPSKRVPPEGSIME